MTMAKEEGLQGRMLPELRGQWTQLPVDLSPVDTVLEDNEPIQVCSV